MSLINAVRVVTPDGKGVWVTDSTSISAYGRREDELRVSDDLSPADIQRTGAAFLAGKKDPSTSVESSPGLGPVPGDDYHVGDLVTVAGAKQRCVDIKKQLNPDNGDWLPPTPTFSTLSNERSIEMDRAFDRLISLQGGGGVDATALPTASLLPAEEVRPLQSLQWSHYDGNDSGSRDLLDDNTRWQEKQIEGPCRAGLIVCIPDYSGATGDTTIELHRNGSLWSGLFNVVIPSTSPGIGFIAIPMWGYSFLDAGDLMSIKCIQNGQHRQLSYELRLYPRI